MVAREFGIVYIALGGEGRWEGRGWCLRRELCINVQRDLACTVEPPNKGHFGNGSFVLCLEVVPYRRQ